jgi:hypothetical protein
MGWDDVPVSYSSAVYDTGGWIENQEMKGTQSTRSTQRGLASLGRQPKLFKALLFPIYSESRLKTQIPEESNAMDEFILLAARSADVQKLIAAA